jgi:hypothetical protein
MDTISNNLEGYLAWLAGDESMITWDEVLDVQSVIFSPEADMIQSIAATELGATA